MVKPSTKPAGKSCSGGTSRSGGGGGGWSSGRPIGSGAGSGDRSLWSHSSKSSERYGTRSHKDEGRSLWSSGGGGRKGLNHDDGHGWGHGSRHHSNSGMWGHHDHVLGGRKSKHSTWDDDGVWGRKSRSEKIGLGVLGAVSGFGYNGGTRDHRDDRTTVQAVGYRDHTTSLYGSKEDENLGVGYLRGTKTKKKLYENQTKKKPDYGLTDEVDDKHSILKKSALSYAPAAYVGPLEPLLDRQSSESKNIKKHGLSTSNSNSKRPHVTCTSHSNRSDAGNAPIPDSSKMVSDSQDANKVSKPVASNSQDANRLNKPVASNSQDANRLNTPVTSNLQDANRLNKPVASNSQDANRLNTPVASNSQDANKLNKPVASNLSQTDPVYHEIDGSFEPKTQHQPSVNMDVEAPKLNCNVLVRITANDDEHFNSEAGVTQNGTPLSVPPSNDNSTSDKKGKPVSVPPSNDNSTSDNEAAARRNRPKGDCVCCPTITPLQLLLVVSLIVLLAGFLLFIFGGISSWGFNNFHFTLILAIIILGLGLLFIVGYCVILTLHRTGRWKGASLTDGACVIWDA